MVAQVIERLCLAHKQTLANFPSFRMVALSLEVLDHTLGITGEPGIFGKIGVPKCPSAQNLNNFVMPV
jgi:hypothetical protein